MSRYCVSLLGVTPGHSGDHWVSGSLVGAIHVPLHMLLALLCTAFLGISCCSAFLESLPRPFFFSFTLALFIIYPIASPLFFQFSVTSAGAEFESQRLSSRTHRPNQFQ